jgi:hypothetical protein
MHDSNVESYYPPHAASALAANCFARMSFAVAFPLFGAQMYEGMTNPKVRHLTLTGFRISFYFRLGISMGNQRSWIFGSGHGTVSILHLYANEAARVDFCSGRTQHGGYGTS